METEWITPEETIAHIVDQIEKYGRMYCTHPNDNVKLFSASRLVDTEVVKRLAIINERNKDVNFISVGHCGNTGVKLENC